MIQRGGAAPDADTCAWCRSQPEVLAAATTDPRPIPEVMADYVAWVRAPPGPAAFAASPGAFDGGWIDHYLRRFTRYGVAQGPYEANLLVTLHRIAARA